MGVRYTMKIIFIKKYCLDVVLKLAMYIFQGIIMKLNDIYSEMVGSAQ